MRQSQKGNTKEDALFVQKEKKGLEGLFGRFLKPVGNFPLASRSIRFAYDVLVVPRYRIEAYIAIVDTSDGKIKILGQEPWDGRGKVTILGGGFKPSDGTPENAAVREVQEEAGLVVDPGKLAPVAYFVWGKSIVFLFVVLWSEVEGEPQPGVESLSLPWVDGSTDALKQVTFQTSLAARLFQEAVTHARANLGQAKGP